MPPRHTPLACSTCHGASVTPRAQCVAGAPREDGTDHRRAGTECDRCGGTGLDPDALLGPWSDYARAAGRWALFEAPTDWTMGQVRARIVEAYGDLTLVEMKARLGRRLAAKEGTAEER